MNRLLCLATLFLVGCSTSPPGGLTGGNGAKYYAVTPRSARFYLYGPQQAAGPDKRLPHNTLLTVVQPVFGYCKVQLLNGEQGYVATEDIQPASSALVAQMTAPHASPTSKFRLSPNDRRLMVPPPPLPVDLPEPTPIPGTEASPSP